MKTELLEPSNTLEEWDAFVGSSPQGSIFCRPWWLRAVCSDQFWILVVREHGEIVAGLPLPHHRRRGLRYIGMPQLTQTLGPLLPPPRSPKYHSRLSREMELLDCLISGIPTCAQFDVRCHYAFTNWLPFYWAGYNQTTRYTYVIDELEDLDKVFRAMSSSYRNKIRKARDAGISVSITTDVDILLDLTRMTFSRQGLQLPYPERLVRQLDAACAEAGSRRIFVTRDPPGRIHSALYVIYDEGSLYNLIQGSDPELRHSGANILAMWHSIQFAQEVTQTYDFEGSMLKSVERVFRDFGGRQRPYFHLSRTNSLPLRIARDVRSWYRDFRDA